MQRSVTITAMGGNRSAGLKGCELNQMVNVMRVISACHAAAEYDAGMKNE
jgi:hypothetical protein